MFGCATTVVDGSPDAPVERPFRDLPLLEVDTDEEAVRFCSGYIEVFTTEGCPDTYDWDRQGRFGCGYPGRDDGDPNCLGMLDKCLGTFPVSPTNMGFIGCRQETVGDAYEWAIDNVIPVLCDPQGPPPTWFEELEVIEGPSDACVFFERR